MIPLPRHIPPLRPAGNAPLLRFYNEAGIPSRAAELKRACLATLEGWRREIG